MEHALLLLLNVFPSLFKELFKKSNLEHIRLWLLLNHGFDFCDSVNSKMTKIAEGKAKFLVQDLAVIWRSFSKENKLRYRDSKSKLAKATAATSVYSGSSSQTK